DGVMVFITVEPKPTPEPVVDHQHVYAAKPDIFKRIVALTDNPAPAALAELPGLLKLTNDLGLAEFSVGAGAVTVKDAPVVAAFMAALAGNGVRESLV